MMHRPRAFFLHNDSFIRLGLAALAVVGLSCAPLAAQTWQELIDFSKLQQRLGTSMPTGAGGVISQVEAGQGAGGAYYVDGAAAQFNGSLDPLGMPVTLTDGSAGAHKGVSAHASNLVGARFFGDTESLAPGANDVVLYETSHWLNSVVKYNSSSPPDAQNFRVQNHSWVGTMATGDPAPLPFIEHPNNVKVLERFDYMIETANSGMGMTAVVGLNNNTGPLPYLLAHSYNAIGVGRTDGIHSSGLTLAPDATPPNSSYGPGRSKPDIVAPLSTTSAATAAVSSAAAFLYDAVDGTAASHNEVIKSLLMAGATKNEFPSWSRTATQPLHETFGVGELNIYNSYLIQLGGQHSGTIAAPATTAGSYGWDYQDHKNNSSIGDIFYNFEIPEGSTAEELSIVLAWNARITDTDPNGGFAPALSLQNLDLKFYDSTGGFRASMIDQSISAVDNVEHLYFTGLDPGTYTLAVTGAAGWDFGLGWRTKTKFDQISADFDGDGVVNGGDFLRWQLNAGTLIGASASDGDADGDGDVDAEDLSAWRAGLIAISPPSFAASVGAIPEPAGAVLAAISVVSLLCIRRARRLAKYAR